ncbi:hypothetical protein ACLB2K_063689 [Fragaria x ananassa]
MPPQEDKDFFSSEDADDAVESREVLAGALRLLLYSSFVDLELLEGAVGDDKVTRDGDGGEDDLGGSSRVYESSRDPTVECLRAYYKNTIIQQEIIAPWSSLILPVAHYPTSKSLLPSSSITTQLSETLISFYPFIMDTTSFQEEQNHATISEMNNDRLASLYQKIAEHPRLLSNAAAKASCCIFRVPQSLLEINGKSYQPHIVSIGPFHRGEPHLRMIQEHKWRYLGSLLSRTEPKGLTLQHYLKSMESMEARARECYSETIHLSSDEFVEMMVLDGCFLIELFRKNGRVVRFELDNPLVNMFWVIPFMVRDFLRLENQIPYFILQSVKSLSFLALDFFKYFIQ